MPRVVESWLRNYLACMAMYLAVGALWAYYIYFCFGNVFFGAGKMPGVADVLEQIKVRIASHMAHPSLTITAVLTLKTHSAQVHALHLLQGNAYYLHAFPLPGRHVHIA